MDTLARRIHKRSTAADDAAAPCKAEKACIVAGCPLANVPMNFLMCASCSGYDIWLGRASAMISSVFLQGFKLNTVARFTLPPQKRE